jgi:capsular polysaccharide biosynthesis protein
MAPGGGRSGGGRGDRQWAVLLLLLAASERLYGALLGLYPEAFRRRYGAEMRRDFAELSREGLGEGGGSELARLWGAAFSDLAVTALKERSAALPRISARATMAIVLMAVTVAVASLIKMPHYEASAYKVRLGERPIESEQWLVQTMVDIMQSRFVADEVIKRENLDTTPRTFIKNLTVEQSESTLTIELSYKSPNPLEARRVVNAVLDASWVRLRGVAPSTPDVMWWQERGALEPLEGSVSPNPLRNGLLALVSGLLVCMGLAFALPRVAASGIGRAALRATRAVGRTASGSREQAATTSLATEVAEEKELLEVLVRRGKLTVMGVALETSFTVEEADRMLLELAAQGHLEVTVEHGELLYSLWERDGLQ